MDRPYRDADWLRRRYHDDRATQREIAEECDVSPRAIRAWMDKHDIETREVCGENHGLYLVVLCRSCHMSAEYGDSQFESGVDDPLNDE